jgi:Flavoprotein
VAAPATFNTINKWAAGISDTLALGLVTEAIGKRLPVVAVPFINAAQAEHPAFQASVDRLRAAGVQLLYGPDVLELHELGTGRKNPVLPLHRTRGTPRPSIEAGTVQGSHRAGLDCHRRGGNMACR